jgi:hypothetical protein
LLSQGAIGTVHALIDLKGSREAIRIFPIGYITEGKLLTIGALESILFLIVLPIGGVERIIPIFLLFFLSIGVVSDEGSRFSVIQNVPIVLLTSITCIRNSIFR